ncbi:MAG TPA: ABC transporter ATP-binding protein [Fimbriimonadaceae bacterium]|nr:ABC transporter ATP-binding protein [Fimbriimonadaceae bacterium]HRJ33609.1 ABC transporter ATP-binding protein [Fimbriimonadaceae bacterium]
MLEIRNLRKTYGDLVAVRDLSFTLEPGDILGFIGTNGAGKTTTIRMVSTLLEPTSGTASINGFDIQRDPMGVRRLIGYMPDFFGLYDDVKAWEYLDFFANIYGIPSKQRPSVIDNVLELTDLTTKRDAFVQSLSRGMQQRLCLARCLVHDPALLLLDEPASGLDPRARAELRELILELGRMGKIVIVSSHILPELAGFCNKVGVIERGELLAFGGVGEVVRSVQPHRKVHARIVGELDGVVATAMACAGVSDARIDNSGSVVIDLQGSHEDQAELLKTLLAKGHRIFEFREEAVNLEDVFLKLTRGDVN